MSDPVKSAPVEKARSYYNSADADNFYFSVWGGEDIHIGLYASDEEPVFEASRRTVETMAEKVGMDAETRVLDIGAGYGGSARYLARRYKASVEALNLSEVENERDRQMNREQGLADRINVVDGNFEDLPYAEASFDVVWSQDAILHSGDRERVFSEVDRVLKPGGIFILTDPLQREDADKAALKPVYDRIHLDNLGSLEAYDGYARALGWERTGFEDHSDQLPRHYQRVHDILESRYDALKETISTDYLDRMRTGLRHWIKAGREGLLRWGLLTYRKPAG